MPVFRGVDIDVGLEFTCPGSQLVPFPKSILLLKGEALALALRAPDPIVWEE